MGKSISICCAEEQVKMPDSEISRLPDPILINFQVHGGLPPPLNVNRFSLEHSSPDTRTSQMTSCQQRNMGNSGEYFLNRITKLLEPEVKSRSLASLEYKS